MYQKANYSRCPKSGRSVFGVFEKRPVVKPSGFRTFGSLTLQPPVIGRSVPNLEPVPNRFQTGLELVLYDINVQNRFQTGLEQVQRLKSGLFCPNV